VVESHHLSTRPALTTAESMVYGVRMTRPLDADDSGGVDVLVPGFNSSYSIVRLVCTAVVILVVLGTLIWGTSFIIRQVSAVDLPRVTPPGDDSVVPQDGTSLYQSLSPAIDSAFAQIVAGLTVTASASP
jgi:hypothetical protein